MKFLFVLAGVVATTFAWPSGQGQGQGQGQGTNWFQQMMNWQGQRGNQGYGNQGYGNQGYGNQGWGSNMGNSMGNWWGQQGGNNWGNQMGGHQMHGNPMGNNKPGLLGLLLLQMLGNMKSQTEGRKDDYGDMDPEHMEEFQKYMKYKMAEELAHDIMMQMELKKAKQEFERAVKSHCQVVDAYFRDMERNNETMKELVSKEDEERWIEGVDTRPHEEAVAELLKTKAESEEEFAEIALKVAKWVCESGWELEKALDEMESKKESCDGDKDDSRSERDD